MHATNIYQRIKLITNICWPKKQVMQTKKMIKNIILENQLIRIQSNFGTNVKIKKKVSITDFINSIRFVFQDIK